MPWRSWLPAFTSRSTVPPIPQGSVPETASSSPAIHTVETARDPAAGTGTAFKLRRESGRMRASEEIALVTFASQSGTGAGAAALAAVISAAVADR